MYVLVGMPGSRTTRVTWMLEEVGADYDFVAARPHSETAYAVNPSGKLPALKVGESVLIDSAAICVYLADRHPEHALTFAAGTIERAQMDSWIQFATNDLEAPLWMHARQTRILKEEQRAPAVLDLCADDWRHALRAFASRLGDRSYVMGERFTVPDVILGHIGRWATYARFPVDTPAVAAYFERVQQRPALKRALQREFAAKKSLA